ncbi:hypothetical protein DIPPA_30261 [Diplonema papillatum]|nr:hypothetical protein DIPPA_31834 [Diplonema papillatum]KAJ9444704.1 hypothetical protein DIPPA_35286 [Diplonema papillatum]KAJ9451515.1 hypothetical protein DIPPA_35455 [Diplonema papillatum]KAJ9455317.1 hypothetical protein DIPPA_22066 [Diplonema papillatum]KAJ9458386.1 hypothetical protein DIPPA_27362 [Diplonema papillatum]
MWAESTLNTRRNLWRRLHWWTSSQGIPINADTAALFVLATSVRPQAQLAYTKGLSAVFGKMGLDNQPLCALASALRGIGGAVPEVQARPIVKGVLMSWARQQSPDLLLCAMVAWKTASRWGDAQPLSSIQFIWVASDEVIIDWFQTPKARRRAPFKNSRFSVIRGDLTPEIAALFRSLAPFSKITAMGTDGLDREWAKSEAMRDFTGHSIKRGAASELYRLVALGTQIPLHLIDRIQKHEEVSGERLADVSIRYGADPVLLARVLKTGEVSKYL